MDFVAFIYDFLTFFISELFSSRTCTFSYGKFLVLFFAVEAVYYKVRLHLLLYMFIYQKLGVSLIWSHYSFTRYKKKVPFEEVPDLVASRRVLIQKGFAFVAGSQVSIGFPFQFQNITSLQLIVVSHLDFLISPISWFLLLSHNFDLIYPRPLFWQTGYYSLVIWIPTSSSYNLL